MINKFFEFRNVEKFIGLPLEDSSNLFRSLIDLELYFIGGPDFEDYCSSKTIIPSICEVSQTIART